MDFQYCPKCEAFNPPGATHCEQCKAELPPAEELASRSRDPAGPGARARPRSEASRRARTPRPEPARRSAAAGRRRLPSTPRRTSWAGSSISRRRSRRSRAPTPSTSSSHSCTWTAKRKDLAIRTLERCLEHDPKNVYMRHRLDQLGGTPAVPPVRPGPAVAAVPPPPRSRLLPARRQRPPLARGWRPRRSRCRCVPSTARRCAAAACSRWAVLGGIAGCAGCWRSASSCSSSPDRSWPSPGRSAPWLPSGRRRVVTSRS